MVGPGDRVGGATGALTIAGLLAAIAIGAVWTAQAVVDGSPGGVLVRFGTSVMAGAYYLVLHRVARGLPALPGPR